MTLRRILALTTSRPGWLVAGAALGALAIVANVALVAVSAALVSRAAFVTNVAELALAITAVRVLAIGRAFLRYGERLVVHAGTFRVLADLRAWAYRSMEPLAPAGLRDATDVFNRPWWYEMVSRTTRAFLLRQALWSIESQLATRRLRRSSLPRAARSRPGPIPPVDRTMGRRCTREGLERRMSRLGTPRAMAACSP